MSGEMKNGHCISTLMVLRPGVLVRMTMTANGTAITRVVTGWSRSRVTGASMSAHVPILPR